MKGIRPALTVKCPRCGAEPGAQCYTGSLYMGGFTHKARSALVVERGRVDEQAILPKHKLGGCPSGSCKHGQHHLCNGKRRSGDIVGGRFCTCSCHSHRQKETFVQYSGHRKVGDPLHSAKCQSGKHGECSKIRRLPNNLYAPCECPCHGCKFLPAIQRL